MQPANDAGARRCCARTSCSANGCRPNSGLLRRLIGRRHFRTASRVAAGSPPQRQRGLTAPRADHRKTYDNRTTAQTHGGRGGRSRASGVDPEGAVHIRERRWSVRPLAPGVNPEGSTHAACQSEHAVGLSALQHRELPPRKTRRRRATPSTPFFCRDRSSLHQGNTPNKKPGSQSTFNRVKFFEKLKLTAVFTDANNNDSRDTPGTQESRSWPTYNSVSQSQPHAVQSEA